MADRSRSARSVCAAAVLFALGPAATAQAQHDPHRNAVRHIAASKWAAAEKELKKADDSDPETLFVRALSAVSQGDLDKGTSIAKSALEAGLPFDRLVAGPRPALAPLQSTPEFAKWRATNEPSSLLHGPMLGAVTDQGARVWIRTSVPAEKVQVEVLDAGDVIASSQIVATTEESDRTALLELTGLRPSTSYAYRVVVDGETHAEPSFRLTTHPAAHKPAKFTVGFGGGAGYVPKWESMWDVILKTKPNAFLMLGDNVYVDDPTHRLTSDYCYYRRQSRPEWRRLTAQTCMYSIYDDHDFGLNDCVPGPRIETPKWKRQVWNYFRTNWANPSYGGGPKQPGCWYDYYIGDVHFIMLDGRYYRTRGDEPTMLGPVQKKWLLETLQKSRGKFVLLASPVPWSPGVKPGSRDTWDGFAEEREEIFALIEKHRMDGVLLVAADRHRSDLRVTRREGVYPLYEFESSKLTNRHTHKVIQTPGLIWGYNKKCSFGLMRFDTTATDPSIELEVHTIDGDIVHRRTIRRSELSFTR